MGSAGAGLLLRMRTRCSPVVVVAWAAATLAPSGCADGVDAGDGKDEVAEGAGEGEGDVGFDEVPLRFVVGGVDVADGGLDFGTLPVLPEGGGGSVDRELQLELVDPSVPVTILSDPPVLLGGRDVDMWSVVTQPSSTLTSAGASMSVRFSPTVAGPLLGKLVVAWGVETADRLIVDVRGVGDGPVAPEREPGLRTAIYDGAFEALPDFDTLTPATTTTQPDLSLAARAGGDNFAYRFQGALEVPGAGSWTLFSTSDDGSRVIVDGAVVVDHDGLHGATEASGAVELTAGLHAFEVQFFEAAGGEALTVSWEGPDVPKAVIPADAFFTSP